MIRTLASAAAFGMASWLSGCADGSRVDVARAVDAATRAEADGVRQVMLTVAEPDQAIAYFQGQIARDPEEVDHRRGLALSLMRGRRPAEAVEVWRAVVASKGSLPEDRVELADALVRTSDWAGARAALDAVPPTHETYARYLLEAVVADSAQDWSRADSFYETASGLTTTPATVLNNWGYSKLTRGDPQAAERLFTQAITYDPDLFTAKNNLVLARATRRDYTLPVVPMTQEERAQLLHTAGLAAVKQGDIDIGRMLLQDAVETSPRHFEEAARALRALDA